MPGRKRAFLGVAIAVGLFLFSGGRAFAQDYWNISKDAHDPAAGVQIVVGPDGETIVFATNGLQQRIALDLVDPETGDGYHGLFAIDLNGDGTADISTFLVTPGNEVPPIAQDSGSPDHGIVDICLSGLCD